jgi:hypothetical protein
LDPSWKMGCGVVQVSFRLSWRAREAATHSSSMVSALVLCTILAIKPHSTRLPLTHGTLLDHNLGVILLLDVGRRSGLSSVGEGRRSAHWWWRKGSSGSSSVHLCSLGVGGSRRRSRGHNGLGRSDGSFRRVSARGASGQVEEIVERGDSSVGSRAARPRLQSLVEHCRKRAERRVN